MEKALGWCWPGIQAIFPPALRMDEYSALGGLGVDASSLPAAYAVAHCEITLRTSFNIGPIEDVTWASAYLALHRRSSIVMGRLEFKMDLPGRSIERPPNHLTLLLIESAHRTPWN